MENNIENNIENNDDILNSFKICLSIEDYKQGIIYFEKIIANKLILEYYFDDIILVNRLVKITLKNFTKNLNNLIDLNKKKENNEDYEIKVLNYFTNNCHNEILFYIQKLLNSTISIKNLIKVEGIEKSLYFKILAKLYKFLFLYDDYDKSFNLEKSLFNYQTSIKLIINCNKDNKNSSFELNIYKYKIIFSYIKFVNFCLKDCFRSVLFCINTMEEIKNEIKNNIIEEENYVDEDYNENLNIMLDKDQLFFDNNIDIYNRILKIYYPEIKKYT
jgi:hypothetical protein